MACVFATAIFISAVSKIHITVPSHVCLSQYGVLLLCLPVSFPPPLSSYFPALIFHALPFPESISSITSSSGLPRYHITIFNTLAIGIQIQYSGRMSQRVVIFSSLNNMNLNPQCRDCMLTIDLGTSGIQGVTT